MNEELRVSSVLQTFLFKNSLDFATSQSVDNEREIRSEFWFKKFCF